MDLLDILRADRHARAADTRNLELRRQYHEFRRMQRLARGLETTHGRKRLAALIRRGSPRDSASGATTAPSQSVKIVFEEKPS